MKTVMKINLKGLYGFKAFSEKMKKTGTYELFFSKLKTRQS